MRNYLAIAALALILPATAHAASDTGGLRVPAPADLIGKSACGLLYGDDGVAAQNSGASRAVCVTIQTGDEVIAQTNAGLLFVGVYRHHPYSNVDYLSAGVLGTVSDAGAWTAGSDVRAFSYAARNRPQCPTSDKRMDGTIGPVRGSGHPKFWADAQGLADMQALCGLTVTDCDPGQVCDGQPAATKPAAQRPAATPKTTTCAPLKAKVGKVTVKQTGGACGQARSTIGTYVKTSKDPAGYVCVKLTSRKQVVAKCRTTSRSKRSTLITGTWRR